MQSIKFQVNVWDFSEKPYKTKEKEVEIQESKMLEFINKQIKEQEAYEIISIKEENND